MRLGLAVAASILFGIAIGAGGVLLSPWSRRPVVATTAPKAPTMEARPAVEEVPDTELVGGAVDTFVKGLQEPEGSPGRATAR